MRIKRVTMNAGAATDHPVVAAAAVDLQEDQETMVETTEFQTLMMNDSPYGFPRADPVTLTHHARAVVAARVKLL
jgi:hypothetical protein